MLQSALYALPCQTMTVCMNCTEQKRNQLATWKNISSEEKRMAGNRRDDNLKLDAMIRSTIWLSSRYGYGCPGLKRCKPVFGFLQFRKTVRDNVRIWGNHLSIGTCKVEEGRVYNALASISRSVPVSLWSTPSVFSIGKACSCMKMQHSCGVND